MWETPIFDRIQADADYARANRGDPNHYKGAFNYTDMRRITNNMHYIADLTDIDISVRANWQPLEKPSAAEVQVLLDDLSHLRNSLSGHLTWDEFEADFTDWNDLESRETIWDDIEFIPELEVPAVPERPIYHYEKINSIEKLIYALEKISRGGD